jgi:hypothetical protein
MKPVSKKMLTSSVVAIALAAAAWGYAQGIVATEPVTPMVLAGPDVGFRVTGRQGDRPVGQLVVRVNGEWKAVEFGNNARPAYAK